MQRLTANAVANRPAKTSAGADSCFHARRCYATLRWASVAKCPLAPLLLRLLGLPLLFQRLLSRLLFHALLRILVLGRHVLTSFRVRVRLSAVAQDVHPLAAQVSLHVRRGSAARIVATPSSSTSTT